MFSKLMISSKVCNIDFKNSKLKLLVKTRLKIEIYNLDAKDSDKVE